MPESTNLTKEQIHELAIILNVDMDGQGNQSCRCPLHDDTHNSGSINFEKRVYNCFSGCGGYTFPALHIAIFGEREVNDNALTTEQELQIIKEIQELSSVSVPTPTAPVKDLSAEEVVAKAKEFISSRGITSDLYKTIGAYPDFDPVSPTYQYLIFPNGAGTVARRFTEGEPRYLNSHGDKNLYNYSNLDRTKDIILVEGIYDVLSLFQLGYTNVCASLGTGFNEPQAYKFRKSNVFILFDRDYAGFTGAIKAKEHLEKMGAKAIIFELPEGFGKDINEGLLKNPEGLANWLRDKLGQYDSTDESYLKRITSGQEKLKCYPSNIAGIDGIMAGGFVEGCHVIAGMPKVGKSTMGLYLARTFANTGATVLYCTYEISKRQCWARLISNSILRPWAQIERDFNVGYIPEFVGLSKKIRVVAGWNIDEIERASRNFDIIMVDYIQRMPGKSDEEGRRISHNIGRLSDLARDYGKVVIVFSSIPRDKYNKDSVGLGKHSGDIEYVAQSQSLLKLGGDFSIFQVQENTRGEEGSVYLRVNLAIGTYEEIETPPFLEK